jgi:hypothetical protein
MMALGGGGGRLLYLFFNLDARWGWLVNTVPWSLYPLVRASVSTHFTGGWLGVGAGLDGCIKSHQHLGFEP